MAVDIETGTAKKVRVQRVFFEQGERRFDFLALTEERVQKRNELPSTDVEAGFPVTQFSRPQPREGSLSAVLVDNPVVNNRLETGITKDDQKEALDQLFDLEATKETIRLVSEMESIPRCLIESVEYSRDKRTNLYIAEVRWKELRTTRTQSVAVKMTGRIDVAAGSVVDAPAIKFGEITTETQQTTEPVGPTDKKSEDIWKNVWGLI